MIRSHALYPAELTARAISNYAIPTHIRQALNKTFTIGGLEQLTKQLYLCVRDGFRLHE